MVSVSGAAEHGRGARTAAFWAAILVALVLGLGGQAIGWFRVLEVQGGSMQPAISNGSLLLTKPEGVRDLAAGDVVSFIAADGDRVTHRVVSVDAATGGVTTRGDANTINDAAPYAGASVDLVVASVPGGGVALRALGQLATNPWTLAGLAVGLLVLAIPTRRPRRAHRAGAAARPTAFADAVAVAVVDGASLDIDVDREQMAVRP